MKKIASFLLVLIIFALFPFSVSADAQPYVSAKSAVLINADDGQILYAKNENDKRPMASTTKIMTALIALETAAVSNKIVTITDRMVQVEGSSMGLMPGDRLSLKSLAEGMLLVSGNDAANSVAIAISGSAIAFSDLMNKRAKELNMTSTHFVTPSGLDDKEHYTTASDLAGLAEAAMKNSDFAEITCKKSLDVQYVSPSCKHRFTNHNKLLSIYNGCIGIKTGFTKKAGRCFVSSAQKNGIRLIAVTLNASDDWNDHKKMLNYGFTKLSSYPIDDSDYSTSMSVVGGTSDSVLLNGSVGNKIVVNTDEVSHIKRTIERPPFIYAPVKVGQVLGVVRYTVNSKTAATTELIADGQVPKLGMNKNIFEIFLDQIKNLFI